MSTSVPPSPEQLAVLSRVVREITRSRRMSPEDVEDFAQSVHLKLAERDYDVFDRFNGRSSLRTYLRVVVRRLLLDWQNSVYGKWRPTVAALRLGKCAVDLERLISRDGHTVDEAIELVRTRSGAAGESELRGLIERLPHRQPRRKVSSEILPDLQAVEFEDPVAARNQLRTQARIRSSLARVLVRLPSDDRRIIGLRYMQKQSVRAVAQALQTDPKALYRRFDRVLLSLRRGLAEQGVRSPSEIDTRRTHGAVRRNQCEESV